MNNSKWIENTILGVIVLNIFVIAFVFLIPRLQFMSNHWGWKPEALMESYGAMDTPNQYSETYKVANQVRKIATEDAVVYIPSDKWRFELNRSVVIQRLYPRKVYFSRDLEVGKLFSGVSNISNSYVVFNEHWGQDLCAKQSVNYLEAERIGICRTKK
ncbi:MAG: hypothetical protein ACI8PD_001379 [Nitrospinales bacterium]|jgi:hypothetical protein